MTLRASTLHVALRLVVYWPPPLFEEALGIKGGLRDLEWVFRVGFCEICFTQAFVDP